MKADKPNRIPLHRFHPEAEIQVKDAKKVALCCCGKEITLVAKELLESNHLVVRENKAWGIFQVLLVNEK